LLVHALGGKLSHWVVLARILRLLIHPKVLLAFRHVVHRMANLLRLLLEHLIVRWLFVLDPLRHTLLGFRLSRLLRRCTLCVLRSLSFVDTSVKIVYVLLELKVVSLLTVAEEFLCVLNRVLGVHHRVHDGLWSLRKLLG
jgi:hypothetical protein